MARFRGHVGNVTRLGHSSLDAAAYGWHIGGRIYVYANDEPQQGPRGGYAKPREVDNITLTLDGGTSGTDKLPGITVYANTDGNYSVFVGGRCVATNDEANAGTMSEVGRGSKR